MAESVRRILQDRRVTGDKAPGAGQTGTDKGASVPEDGVNAQAMKAETLAHLAMTVVFMSAYRELLAKESKDGASLRPLLNQLCLDVAKLAAALEGVESMAHAGLPKE